MARVQIACDIDIVQMRSRVGLWWLVVQCVSLCRRGELAVCGIAPVGQDDLAPRVGPAALDKKRLDKHGVIERARLRLLEPVTSILVDGAVNLSRWPSWGGCARTRRGRERALPA